MAGAGSKGLYGNGWKKGAYQEINEMESHMANAGAVVC